MNIKDIVKDNFVYFHHYRHGYMYYTVEVDNAVHIFPVPISDVGDASLNKNDKAIYFMRYIRRALEDSTFQWLQDVKYI